MIERLSKEQVALFPKFRDKWLEIGLSCEPCDVEASRRALNDVYAAAGLPPPKLVLVLDGPISAAIGAAMLKRGDQVWAQVWAQVREKVGAQVRAQVRAQVWAQVREKVGEQVGEQVREEVGEQVRDQVREQVWDQVRDQVGEQVWDQVRDQVWDQVGVQVWAQVGEQVGEQVREQVGEQVRDQVRERVKEQVWGNLEAGWLSWCDYFGEAVGLECCSRAAGLSELAKHCGWWAPYQGLAILQHRPAEIHRKGIVLHRDGGPSVLYRDGFSVWSLNGVRVPQWLAETPAEQIDPLAFAKEENVEIRREIVRKVGVERLCAKLKSKVLDRQGNYELHLVPLGGNTGSWPYLKMKNPSIGVFHMEAVPRECDTVEKALNFRNGGPLEHLAPIT